MSAGHFSLGPDLSLCILSFVCEDAQNIPLYMNTSRWFRKHLPLLAKDLCIGSYREKRPSTLRDHDICQLAIKLPHLRSFTLNTDNVRKVMIPYALRVALSHMPNLQTLLLGGSSNLARGLELGHPMLEHAFTKLRYLGLNKTMVTDSNLYTVSLLAPTLQSVRLTSNYELTNLALKAVLAAPRLEILYFSQKKFTAEGFEDLLSGTPHPPQTPSVLRDVVICGSHLKSDNTLIRLAKLPAMRILTLVMIDHNPWKSGAEPVPDNLTYLQVYEAGCKASSPWRVGNPPSREIISPCRVGRNPLIYA
jgi:hypothetical protein